MGSNRRHRQRTAVISCLALALVIACGQVSATNSQSVTITNGVRFTTAGVRVDAHSGTILHAQDGFFYWYGDTYACGYYWTDPSTPYCGVQVYRSPNLVRWDGPSAFLMRQPLTGRRFAPARGASGPR